VSGEANPDLSQLVAQTADAADLHAPVPTLLLELQTMLGSLSATVTRETNRGRRPFRPTPDWSARLGELAYGIYLLADQTGVDVAAALRATAYNVRPQAGYQPSTPAGAEWPFETD
jgi:hypothetical protein